MEPAQTFLRVLVDNAVVFKSRLPAHAADKADCFHCFLRFRHFLSPSGLVSRLASFFPMSSAETGHFQGESSSPLGASFLSADPLGGRARAPPHPPPAPR